MLEYEEIVEKLSALQLGLKVVCELDAEKEEESQLFIESLDKSIVIISYVNELIAQLERWEKLLSQDGANTKGMVRKDISYMLKNLKLFAKEKEEDQEII